MEDRCVGTEGVECNCRAKRISLDKPVDRSSVVLERGADYGPVRENHRSIGMMWGGVLSQAQVGGRWYPGLAIPPDLVCLMMAAVKMSREAHKHKMDNVVDAKNYWDFVEELNG